MGKIGTRGRNDLDLQSLEILGRLLRLVTGLGILASSSSVSSACCISKSTSLSSS